MTIKMLRQICSRWDFQATALGFPGFTEQSESKYLWGLKGHMFLYHHRTLQFLLSCGLFQSNLLISMPYTTKMYSELLYIWAASLRQNGCLEVFLRGRASTVGFPSGSDGKESACNVGDLGSIPGSGRSPGGGHGLPTPVFLPGEFHGQRSLTGYSPCGRRVGHDWATNNS